jgi:phosphoribosylaminoimidazole carboxylase (NCAIR synthetase)
MIIPIFIARTPSVTLHRYGKSPMSQRKVHHVTVDSKDTSFLPLQRIPQITTVVIQTEANPQGMSGADLANLLNEARFERA